MPIICQDGTFMTFEALVQPDETNANQCAPSNKNPIMYLYIFTYSCTHIILLV